MYADDLTTHPALSGKAGSARVPTAEAFPHRTALLLWVVV
jgi:hypothetical protein